MSTELENQFLIKIWTDWGRWSMCWTCWVMTITKEESHWIFSLSSFSSLFLIHFFSKNVWPLDIKIVDSHNKNYAKWEIKKKNYRLALSIGIKVIISLFIRNGQIPILICLEIEFFAFITLIQKFWLRTF